SSQRKSKMQRLPKDYRVEKRPLLRPPIPTQYASSQHPKIIYISTKTPFMSAVKRVQKLLLHAETRSAQSASAQVSSSRPKYSAAAAGNDEISDIERVAAVMAANKHERDEVILKATGKAIAKALSLGVWFQQRAEYAVRIETGTVGAIDDIVPSEDAAGEEEDQKMKDDGQEDIPESRIRFASTIQIFVSAAS
ncbi:hypothetical protein M436DRAFT_15678, partial [Aureobasidium namibiae CBS 147.97]